MIPTEGSSSRRTGFLDKYETPDQIVRRNALAKQAESRTRLRSIFSAAMPSVRDMLARRTQERALQLRNRQRQAVQDLPFQRVAEAQRQATQAKREQFQQELAINQARARFRQIEQNTAPLTLDEATNIATPVKPLLGSKQMPIKLGPAAPSDIARIRVQPVEVQPQLSPRHPGAPRTVAEQLKLAATERQFGISLDALPLTPKQKELVRNEIDKRGVLLVSNSDVYRFAGNVLAGKEPGLPGGIYAQPEYSFDKQSAADLKPLETFKDAQRGLVPLAMQQTTAYGRLLEKWKQENRSQAPQAQQQQADQETAKAFFDRVDELRGLVRDNLDESKVKDPEKYVDPLVEMELRRAELLDQAKREWQVQRGLSAKADVPDGVATELGDQVDKVVNAEFKSVFSQMQVKPQGLFNKAIAAVSEIPGLNRLVPAGVAALELAESIVRAPSTISRGIGEAAGGAIGGERGAEIGGAIAGGPTGLSRELGDRLAKRAGLDFRLSRPLDIFRSDEERDIGKRFNFTSSPTLNQELGTVLFAVQRGRLLESLLPEYALENIEHRLGPAGPAARRFEEFFTSPVGLASLLIPGFAKMAAIGEPAGIAAATAARVAGAPPAIEIGAQLAGNILTPGAGLVPVRVAMRGPLRPLIEVTETYKAYGLFPPETAIKVVEERAAKQLITGIIEDLDSNTIDIAAIATASPPVANRMYQKMGTRAAAYQLAQNMLSAGIDPQLIRPTLQAMSNLGRDGARALAAIPEAVKGSRIWPLIMRNLNLGGVGRVLAEETGALRLGGELQEITTQQYARALRNIVQREEGRVIATTAETAPIEDAVMGYARARGTTIDDLLREFADTRQVPADLTETAASAAEDLPGGAARLAGDETANDMTEFLRGSLDPVEEAAKPTLAELRAGQTLEAAAPASSPEEAAAIDAFLKQKIVKPNVFGRIVAQALNLQPGKVPTKSLKELAGLRQVAESEDNLAKLLTSWFNRNRGLRKLLTGDVKKLVSDLWDSQERLAALERKAGLPEGTISVTSATRRPWLGGAGDLTNARPKLLSNNAQLNEAVGKEFEKSGGHIRNWLYQSVESADIANDITATVFERTLVKLSTLRGAMDEAGLRQYLWRSARNALKDYFRSQAVDHDAFPKLIERLTMAQPLGPEEAALAAERSDQLRGAISWLTPAEQQLIGARYAEGMPLDNAAKALDLAPATARKQLSRAIIKLRAFMRELSSKEAGGGRVPFELPGGKQSKAQRQAIEKLTKTYPVTDALEEGSSFVLPDGRILKINSEAASHVDVLRTLDPKFDPAQLSFDELEQVLVRFMEDMGTVRVSKQEGVITTVIGAELRGVPTSEQVATLEKIIINTPQEGSLYFDLYAKNAKTLEPFGGLSRGAESNETVAAWVREFRTNPPEEWVPRAAEEAGVPTDAEINSIAEELGIKARTEVKAAGDEIAVSNTEEIIKSLKKLKRLETTTVGDIDEPIPIFVSPNGEASFSVNYGAGNIGEHVLVADKVFKGLKDSLRQMHETGWLRVRPIYSSSGSLIEVNVQFQAQESLSNVLKVVKQAKSQALSSNKQDFLLHIDVGDFDYPISKTFKIVSNESENFTRTKLTQWLEQANIPTREVKITQAGEETAVTQVGAEQLDRSGLRIHSAMDGTRLTPEAERVLERWNMGQEVSRAELVEAALAEGLPPAKVARARREVLVQALASKKDVLESISAVTNDSLRADVKIPGELRTKVERLISLGRKATLGDLRATAKKLGLELPPAEGAESKRIAAMSVKKMYISELHAAARSHGIDIALTKNRKELEPLVEQARIAETKAQGLKSRYLNELSKLITPRGVTQASPRAVAAPSVVKPGAGGPLSRIEPSDVKRVLTDIVEQQNSPDHLQKVRFAVEQELERTNQTADEVVNSTAWLEFGRSPVGGAGAQVVIDTRSAMRDFEEATRGLRYSPDPVTRGRAIADEAINFETGGTGGGGGSKIPTGPTVPHPEDPAGKGRSIPTSGSLAFHIQNFEWGINNWMGAATRLVGKAPPLRHMIEWVNPSNFFKPEGPAGSVFGGYLGKSQAERGLLASLEYTMQRDARKLFKFSDNIAVGITSKSGEAMTPEYLVEAFKNNPSDLLRAEKGKMLGGLTDKQNDFLTKLTKMLDEQKAYEEWIGVAPDALWGEDVGAGTYFPHIVIKSQSKAEREAAALAGKDAMFDFVRGYQRDRYFSTMYEGMQAGEQYADGLVIPVMARIRAGRAAALDAEVVQALSDIPGALQEFKVMLGKAQQDGAGAVVNYLSSFNNIARPLVTNFDLGFIGLQLVPAGARNPVAGVQGILMTIDGIANTSLMASYMKRQLAPQEFLGGKSWLEDFFASGGIWNQSEFTWEFAAQGRGLSWLNKGLGARFNHAFSNGVNIASLETYKGMVGVNDSLFRLLGNRRATSLITRAFAGFIPIEGQTSRQMAASVANKLTLRMNSAALGISRGQARAEAGLLFAPRYYRAAFGLLGDAIQGGLRGAEARRALGQLIASVFATNYGLQAAGAGGLDLQPFKKDGTPNPNFMTMQIGNLHVGPGGPFLSIFNLLVRSTARDREGDYMLDLPFGVGLNPGLAKWDLSENPIMRWGRGKLSPVAGLVVDLLSTRNWQGEKIDNPMDFLNVIAQRVMPFSLQAGYEAYKHGDSLRNIAISVGFEYFTGARTWPTSAYERLRQARDDEAQRLFNKQYSELSGPQKAQINEAKQIQDLAQVANDLSRTRELASVTQRDKEAMLLDQWVTTGEVRDTAGKVVLSQFTTQAEDNGLFDRGEVDGQQWIARYKDRQDAYYNVRDGLRVGLHLGETGTSAVPKGQEFPEPTLPVDKAIDAYFSITPKTYLDPTGEPDWDTYFPAKERAYRAALTAATQEGSASERARVEKMLRPIEQDPVVLKFKGAQGIMTQLKEMPKYRFLNAEESTQVDVLLTQVQTAQREAKLNGGDPPAQREILRSLLTKLSPGHSLYKVVAVAFLRSTPKTREAVWNPERDQLVLNSPDAVKFYISLYRNMSEINKILFLQKYGNKYFSSNFITQEGLDLSGAIEGIDIGQ